MFRVALPGMVVEVGFSPAEAGRSLEFKDYLSQKYVTEFVCKLKSIYGTLLKLLDIL